MPIMTKRDGRHKGSDLAGSPLTGLFALSQTQQLWLVEPPLFPTQEHVVCTWENTETNYLSQPWFILVETALNKTLQFCDSSGVHTPSNHLFAMLAKSLLVTQNSVQRSGNTHHTSDQPLLTSQHIALLRCLVHLLYKKKTDAVW